MSVDPRSKLAALSPEKRKLLEQKLRMQRQGAAPSGPAARPRTGEPFPISLAQRRLWVLERLHPGTAAYNIPFAIRIRGALDTAALERAMDGLRARHETLRTTFAEHAGEPAQVIHPFVPVPLEVEDLSSLPAAEREGEAERRVRDEAHVGFDVERGPLTRVRLIRVAPDDHLLAITMHHIVSDGWSLGVMTRELGALYDAFRAGRPDPLPPLAIQFADYAAWEREHFAGGALEKQLAFWRGALAGAPPALELPEDHPRTTAEVRPAAMLATRIDSAAAAPLRALAQAEGTTLFAVLIAAYRLVLARHAGAEDVVIGTVAAGRTRPEVAGLVGFFVNTLPLRTSLDGDPTFREMVRRERETLLDAMAHQELPFDRVIEELKLPRDLGRSPLVQATFLFGGAGEGDLPKLGDATVQPAHAGLEWAKFDVTLAANEDAEGVSLVAQWAADLFDRETIERMVEHVVHVLDAAGADPDRPLSSIDLLSDEERERVVGVWGRGAEMPEARPVHRAFEARAALAPEATAVISVADGTRWTYTELNARANRLARRLRALGVGAETRVAVVMERSAEMVAALYATMKAGGAYVPVDPGYPAERVAHMLADSGAAVVLTQSALADQFASSDATVIAVDSADLSGEDDSDLPGDVDPESLVYAIYTSGSTGLPKGAGIPHRALANHMAWMQDAYPLDAGDRVLQKTPFSFDASVWEFHAPLMAGATLVMASPGAHRDPSLLLGEAEAHGITIVQAVPALLRAWLETGAMGRVRTLRRVYAGGEPLAPDLVRAIKAELPDADVINLYGPTETCVQVTSQLATGREKRATVPLGRPVHNTRTLVLDGEMRPVPVGVPGELYLGGPQVGRGYLGRPAQTAATFLPDPFAEEPGARLYRTGDRVRMGRDGELEFLGRVDQQVKVRGFRIDPGEVEAALRAVPGVADAVVAPREDAAGMVRLVAWTVSENGPLPSGALREALRRTLPEYMVPSAIVPIDRIPHTPSGKVDRRALPEPELAGEQEYVAPSTPAEVALAELWAGLLGVPRVGAADDFFTMGGHSLLAARLVSRVREVLGVDLPLRAVFEASTLSALAARVEGAQPAAESASGAGPIPKADRSKPLPLSFSQERLWFLEQLDPGSPAYNIPVAMELPGEMDLAALERALVEIVRRHEALRTAFVPGDEGATQRILPPDAFRVERASLAWMPAAEREAEIERRVAAEARRPFDLAAGPLLRATLLEGTGAHTLTLVFHHAASDAWSSGVFLGELTALYGAFRRGEPSPLAELPVQYADFAAWQRGWLRGDELERQLSFWRDSLKGAPSTIDLPTDRPRPAVQDLAGAMLHFALSPEASAAARTLAGREGATPFMALLAAFAAVLHRWSGEEDLVLGTPVANRGRAELEEVIGFFGNTLPLRADLSGEPSFRELVARVRGVTMDAFAHQDVPFEKLVDALGLDRSLSHSPIFQVMFTLNAGNAVPPALAEMGIGWRAPEVGTSRFDLTVGLYEGGDATGAYGGWAEYATALFDGATIERLMSHLDALLRAAAADPDASISALPILSEEERTRVVATFNATDHAADGDTTLHGMVAAQAARTPDALAVEFAGERLTYADLEVRANRLANRLIRLGVTRDDRVAVCLERSIEMPIAVLAVLKAGGGYVAVDPAYPADRIAYMLEDSRASVVLTTSDVAARLPEIAMPILRLDSDAEEIAREAADAPAVAVDPENLGYVLYTSGSTGKPKGAALPHRALVNVVRWQVARFGDRPAARTLQFASLSFDVSFQEIFSAWAAGGSLVLVDDETRRDAERLMAYLREHGVERLYLPFAALQNLAEVAEGTDARLPALREIITAGEALRSTPQLRAFHAANPGLRLDNHYGPSETHVISAHLLAESPDAWPLLPPIGAPVANVRLYVLDGRMNPAPVGVPGELYAGGVNLARGYLGRAAMTAEKFVPDPFSAEPGARLYRTGDRAKWRMDGELEYIGRTDFQVKLRGFRVEPGEVEAVLGLHPSVREAAVAVRGEGVEKRLVAYVVPVDGAKADTAELKAHVAAHLPEYMVPSAWVTLERMPLTPSGKVDRRALPEPDLSASDAERVAPRNPAEEVVAGIWERVLGVRPGVHDDFFSLGGHSLRATQVISRVREAFGIDLPLRALFESPTVEGLAARAVAARAGEEHRGPPLVPVGRDRPLPLSFAQQRFWFLERMGAAPAAYNIPATLRLRGELDTDALARAVDRVVERHEVLRTVFHVEASEPAQVILPGLRVPLETADLTHLPMDEREAAAKEMSDEEARTPFDLAAGPLMRARLIRVADDDHLLLLNLHHAVADGWSLGVLFRELAAFYDAERDGTDAGLAPLPVQYADYAVWQRQRLDGEALEREVGFWRDRLTGAATLGLPTDHPHPPVQNYRGAMRTFALSPETSAKVAELARRSGATTYMALLAAFDALLMRWSGTEDVVVGSPVAGRTTERTEGLIGVFLNTLALRTDLGGDPTFRELVGRVRETTLDAYAHQEVPFERLVEALRVERSLARHPLFQVMFTLQTSLPQAPRLGELAVEMGEGDTGTAKIDLSVAMVESGDAVHGVFQYAADLWEPETIARMAEHFTVLVDAAAADPDRRLSELPLLGAGEERIVLREWARTEAFPVADTTLHAMFEAQADRTPETIAATSETEELTYAQLDARANRLAHRLRRMGVGPERRVAILLERSVWFVAAELAGWKTGGAFVPLDPMAPVERLAWMIRDSGALALVTRAEHRDRLGAAVSIPVIAVDEDAAALEAESAERPGVEVDPDGLGYVIYTSGTTGRPKGTMLAHRGPANLFEWYFRKIHVEHEQSVMSSSPAFDASVWEIWAPLMAGGATHVPTDAERTSGRALLRFIERRRVTYSFFPTPIAEAMLEALEHGAPLPPTLRSIAAGGDALRRRAPEGVQLLNHYGPTENSVVSTWADVRRDTPGLPPIGRPVDNTRTYVLDARLRPVPIGVVGELFVAGIGLARGYLDRPGLTAERFIPDPFADEPGERMYRTGDRVRWLRNGEIEFLGRADHQVKVRGYRIEPGEIEVALLAHAAVGRAAVVVREDTGEKRLVAYLEPAPDAAVPTAGELRAWLRERLPDYMVPAAFVAMDEIPMSLAGKVDRARLPAPSDTDAGRGAASVPQSGLEREIAAVWREVLGLGTVGLDDNFFEIGGHSLLVARMQERLREKVGREVSVVDIFQYPTVGSLAAHLESTGGKGDAPKEEAAAQKSAERGAGRREMMLRRRK